MVITCEKCSTRFNLDESLLKKEGSKVRCCRCRHVFTAFPPTTPVLPDAMAHQGKSSEEFSGKTQDKINPDVFMEPEPDAFSLDNEQDNELDLGFTVDPDDLTLDDDLELDQSLLQETDPEFSKSSQDHKTDNSSHGTRLDFDDDMDFENELELEDYGELDLSSQDLNSLESNSDMDFHFDMDLDLDKDLESELNLDLDTYEPGMDLLVNGTQEKAGHGIVPGDEDTRDDLNLEDDLDLEFDLEMEPDGSDKFPPDPDTEGLKQDEEISLAEFDEILEAGEGDLEVEDPEEFTLDDSLELPASDEIDNHEFSGSGREMQGADPNKGQKPQLLPVVEEENETSIAPPLLDSDINEPFKKPIKTRKPITIILLLAILILVAYSACIFYGVKIPFISAVKVPYLNSLFTPEPPALEPVNLAPDKQSVNGRFVTNSTAGTLFVITGKVTNTSNVTLSQIKVKGTLITRDKVKTKTKIVPCGNLIPEDQLKNAEMSQINLMLAGENESSSSSDNIQPGRSIPFMIVFSDLPENLENFTVNTEEFKRKTKEN